jgi:DUF2905 family protein
MTDVGKLLLIVGLVLAALGAVMMLGGRVPLGRLPGDIVWRKGSTVVYVPIVTCIVLSLLLTLILSLVRR